jgi:uncharacterized protein with von Willebrand factor type A (vWA) domain
MVDLEDMLLEIFEALRQQRVPLGISDYMLALKAISELTDPEDLENIKGLCRLIWTKSYTDQLLFDETFDIEVNKQLQAIQKKEQQSTFSSGAKPPFPARPNTASSQQSFPEKRQQPKHPLVIPKARSQPISTTNSKDLHYKRPIKYHLTPRAPMDKRDMAGVWRKLRRLQREELSDVLDVQATIDELSQTGFLLKPVLQYRRRNQAKLLVMIDQGGSMEPFTLFIDVLLDSILRSGSLRQVDIFYFHDTPEGYLYRYPTLLGARPLDSVLTEYCQDASVLIIGDAGAARGHYDSIRLRVTREFLETVSEYTYLSGWLNPVPKVRWTGTTAWHIAQVLPMFQLDWEGLNDLVNVLRGQSQTGAQT